MNQRQTGRAVTLFSVALLALVGLGCDKPADVPAESTVQSTRGGIVSLSPAATDLLIAMKAADRVVGVSNYEPATSPLSGLPHVGDYLRTDWEKVDAARPGYMIVQGKKDRLPAGLHDQAAARGIKLLTIQIDRLADISAAAQTLQDTLGLSDGKAFRHRFDDDLFALSREATARQGERPAVRALLVVGDEGTSFVGHETFLDDVLTLAGGTNVVTSSGYPSLDREKIAELSPDVILLLLPGADEAAVTRAKAVWQALPNLAAVKNDRVYALTDPHVLQPGSRVAETGREMAKLIHTAR